MCCDCLDFGRVRSGAKPGHDDFGKFVLCHCQGGDKLARVAYQPVLHGVPRHLWHARLEGSVRCREVGEAEAYVESWPPKRPVLTMIGEPGRGKSHVAAAILRAAFEQHRISGWFFEVPQLLDRMRATQRPDPDEELDDLTNWLNGIPLLVLDELGEGRQTEFVDERLYRVVNGRYGNGKPTVLTANTDGWDKLEAKLRSRLGDVQVGTLVRLNGPDRRRSAIPKEQRESEEN